MSSSESEVSSKQIYDLLLALQQDNQKLTQRLNELEKRAPPSPTGFELVNSRDYQETKIDTNADFIGAIDQGTTSSRFLIFSKDGEPVAMVSAFTIPQKSTLAMNRHSVVDDDSHHSTRSWQLGRLIRTYCI